MTKKENEMVLLGIINQLDINQAKELLCTMLQSMIKSQMESTLRYCHQNFGHETDISLSENELTIEEL